MTDKLYIETCKLLNLRETYLCTKLRLLDEQTNLSCTYILDIHICNHIKRSTNWRHLYANTRLCALWQTLRELRSEVLANFSTKNENTQAHVCKIQLEYILYTVHNTCLFPN